MDTLTHPTVRRVLDRARRDPDVLAGILFGSHARGEASAASDVDLCLVLAADTITNLAMSRTRLAYLAEGAGDLVISSLRRLTYHYWFHLGESQAVRQMLGHHDLPTFVGDINQAPYMTEA